MTEEDRRFHVNAVLSCLALAATEERGDKDCVIVLAGATLCVIGGSTAEVVDAYCDAIKAECAKLRALEEKLRALEEKRAARSGDAGGERG